MMWVTYERCDSVVKEACKAETRNDVVVNCVLKIDCCLLSLQ